MFIPAKMDKAIGIVSLLALLFVFLEIGLELFIRPKRFREIQR